MIVHRVKEFSIIGYIYKERLKLEDKWSKNLSHRINFCHNSQFVAHKTTLKRLSHDMNIFVRARILKHYFLYVRWWFSKFVDFLLLKKTKLRFLLAPIKIVNNSENSFIKGSVKWKKRGGVIGINRWALYSSTFPQIFYCFLKDPSPLNNKKSISAA